MYVQYCALTCRPEGLWDPHISEQYCICNTTEDLLSIQILTCSIPKYNIFLLDGTHSSTTDLDIECVISKQNPLYFGTKQVDKNICPSQGIIIS